MDFFKLNKVDDFHGRLDKRRPYNIIDVYQ